MFGWMFGWFWITPGWSTDRPTTWQKHVQKIFDIFWTIAVGYPRRFSKSPKNRAYRGEITAKQLCDLLFFCLLFFIGIIGLKASENSSASIWYDNFSSCWWENLKLLMFMISGFWDVSRPPNTNYFYLWRHQETWNKSRKSPGLFC